MATTKPTKPLITLPPAFGTSSSNVKTPYTAQELIDGYSASIQQILDGGNVNWLNDTFFKYLTYTTALADWLNSIPANQIPFINSSNQLDYHSADFLPDQTGKAGKYLKTDGTNPSWDVIDTLPSQTGHAGSVLTTNGTTASWQTTGQCIVVIQTKRPTPADPTWYRVYSDGWVEQGGFIEATSNALKTITLPIQMEDTNYFVQATNQYTGTTTACISVSNNTTYQKTTSVVYFYNASSTTMDAYWEVKGYKAV